MKKMYWIYRNRSTYDFRRRTATRRASREEEGSGVGNHLLHHPLVRLYPLVVGALALAFLRDSLRPRR
jgi:hypothetical protein